MEKSKAPRCKTGTRGTQIRFRTFRPGHPSTWEGGLYKGYGNAPD